jgi:AAA family ATP:ADP antiporter
MADALLFLGPFRLMLVAGAILLLCLGLTWITHRREAGRARGDRQTAESAPLSGANGFSLVLRDRYLLLFAGLIFVLNWVTKTGDYVLDRKLLAAAHDTVQAHGLSASAYVGQFKARYFEWVNGVGVALQLFAVSRIIKYLGLRAALVFMPLASLAGYGASFATPLLGVLFAARVVESSLDYSLSNTTRQALWLPTSRDAKYKAKQVIDTFVVRAGDVMSAGLVWIGSHAALSDDGFLGANLVLSGVWLGFALLLGQSYQRAGASRAVPLPVPVRSGGS